MRERKQKKGEKKLIKNKWGIIGAAVVLTASLAGAGFWYAGHSENKPSDEKTASEKEIENINPRDNVLDESEAFEGKIPSLKEKKQLKDAEKRKLLLKNKKMRKHRIRRKKMKLPENLQK